MKPTILYYAGLTIAYKLAGYTTYSSKPKNEEEFGLGVRLKVDWHLARDNDGKLGWS